MTSQVRNKLFTWTKGFKEKMVGFKDQLVGSDWLRWRPEDLEVAGWEKKQLLELCFTTVEDFRSDVANQNVTRGTVTLAGMRLLEEIGRAIAFDPRNNKEALQDEYTQLNLLIGQHEDKGTNDEVGYKLVL